MHPYVILKQPGKAFFYFFTIMIIFLAENAYGMRDCSDTCFGPVSKVKLYNELSHSYVHVAGNSVVADETEGNKVALYKISSGHSFYLYDQVERKFICWRTRSVNKNTLVARRFRNILKKQHLCKFKEKVSEMSNKTHVEYVAEFNNALKINFNKRGKSLRKRCEPHIRHQNCAKAAAFLVSHACTCSQAIAHFCLSILRNMTELRDICRDNKVRISASGRSS